MVGDRQYTRRCRACWHTQQFALPALKVGVLYLDQNVVSNVLRTLDPTTSEKRRKRLAEEGMQVFFRTAFEKIDRLSKLHLLVCPGSAIHYNESVVSTDFKKLKRLNELLSHGVSFWRPEQIRNAELHNAAVTYSGGPANSLIELSPERVVNGNLNAWRDWFQITLNTGVIPGLVDELREARHKKHDGFAGVWQMWQRDSDKTFEDWYREERMALSNVLRQTLSGMLRRHIEIRFGRRDLGMEDLLPDDNERLVMNLKRALCGDDPDPAGFKRVWEFLESDALDEVPYVRISSLLFAAFARRARNKQTCPKRHPFNDVDAVAAYLPFCDAMFLDKEMASLIAEEPVRSRLGYAGRVFSLRNKNEFLAYLDSIEANAPMDIFKRFGRFMATDGRIHTRRSFTNPSLSYGCAR